MELSEVVSAHFAFPVVGVVLCAVLVFAFGFKAPMQPPSFDLLDDEDDRKYRRPKQKKHKSGVDGHVINIDGHGSPGAKSAIKQQTPTPSNRQTSNEKADSQLAKSKMKKPKPVTDMGVASGISIQEEDAEATGEWTKAVSKKDRKNRSKKDDGFKKDDIMSAKNDCVSVAHEIPKGVQANNPSSSSRDVSGKTDEVVSNRTYRKNMEVTVTAPAPAPVPGPVSCTAIAPDADAVSVNASSFSRKVKSTVVRVSVPAQPLRSTRTTVEPSNPSLNTFVPSPAQDTPKKGSETLTSEGSSKVLSVPTATANKSRTEEAELPSNSNSMASAGDGKPAKSPKKKKKSPESREKYKESPVVTIPGNMNRTTSATVDQQIAAKSGRPDDDAADEVQTVAVTPLPEPGNVNSSSNSSDIQLQCSPLPSDVKNIEKTCLSAVTVPPPGDSPSSAAVAHTPDNTVTAAQPSTDSHSTDDTEISVPTDELGDWQQAKPLKKKRKLNREN